MPAGERANRAVSQDAVSVRRHHERPWRTPPILPEGSDHTPIVRSKGSCACLTDTAKADILVA